MGSIRGPFGLQANAQPIEILKKIWIFFCYELTAIENENEIGKADICL